MKKGLLLIALTSLVAITAVGIYKVPKVMERKGCASSGIPISKKWDSFGDVKELKVLMIGDAGMGDENQLQVATASARTCEEIGCDMALYLGDNFYQEGVENVEDPRFVEWFEKVYPQDIPFYAILGNHDIKGNWRAQIEYTDRSKRWIMPDTNYRFAAGPVQFYAVNTNCSHLALSQLETSESSPWKVIFGHRPPLSSGNHGGLDPLASYFLEKLDFDFYMGGHDHLLEHLQKEGRDVIVSGGGGGVLQGKEGEDSPHSRFISRSHGYAWARFRADSAEVVFFDQEGKKLYGFTRKK